MPPSPGCRREKALLETEAIGLPAPRLQLTWLPLNDDWSEKECIYTVVIPLREHDIRREDEMRKKVRKEMHLTVSITTTRGGPAQPIKCPYSSAAPFRDGAHAYWDSKVLGNLPVYAVCDGDYVLLDNKPEENMHGEQS